MSDQAAEAAPAEIQAEPSGQDAASATEGSIQIAPLSTAQSDNGKLVGWVASAYGNAKMAVRTEKNLRLFERIIDDSLTLAFDLLKLMGEGTVSGVKRLHRTITEASAPQTLNNSSPPVSSDRGGLMLLNEVTANVTPQPSPVAGAGSSSKKYALAKLMQVLERDPDLEHNDPELCRKTHLAIARICADELNTIDFNTEIELDAGEDKFFWRDPNIASKARNLSFVGVEHGEKYCDLTDGELQDDAQKVMAYLHATTALIGRADRDYQKAHLHNTKRLRLAKSPDELSDRAIEGMLADAHRAGGGMCGAEMLMLFTELEDQPGWESLTPRIRKICTFPDIPTTTLTTPP